MTNHTLNTKGFTLVELLIVITVIGILAGLVLNTFGNVKEDTLLARAETEFKTMDTALKQYLVRNESYPPDVNRNLPPGIEEFLTPSDIDRWPDGPWEGSVYDYDSFIAEGIDTVQISIRFCNIGDPDSCNFPRTQWAENFDVNSSVYFCLTGSCRAHPSQPIDHPGYCVNCFEEE